jgi:uncharacterized protein (UPF0210 family)
MKIRSITYFLNPQWPLDEKALQHAGEFNQAALSTYESAGYEVQTSRLATVSFTRLLPGLDPTDAIKLTQELGALSRSLGFGFFSLGPATPESSSSYKVIPAMLDADPDVFLSGSMTTHSGEVSLPAVRACAEIIHRVAPLSPDGFSNLRFAALANVPSGAPFFPAAYHNGDKPAFALAIEAADLAVEAFASAGTILEGRQRLVEAINTNAQTLTRLAEELGAQFALPFGGIDFSLAPFPEEARSIGTALERLGAPAAGLAGSLAAATILADTLDQAQFKHAGFSGLFLPVLEDVVLAKRAAEGTLHVKDLLMYSAVCGTGLDTIPLPGDTSQEAMAAILLDLAALALRLDKPLTARLMPIPGKEAGDVTGFDFAYFANSRVLAVNATTLAGLLAGDETIPLQPRNAYLR